MSNYHRDYSLDALLNLHETQYFVGDKGHSVQFDVSRVSATKERPHGLKYSLTVHDEEGTRIAGFDNAHPVRTSKGPGGRRDEYDHKHRFTTIRPYDYKDAVSLLEDFWNLAEDVLEAEGVKLEAEGVKP